MKDEAGNPMLMKLKDWPPDNDFAAALPDHFDDLMQCIPLKVRDTEVSGLERKLVRSLCHLQTGHLREF